ncbi:MAG: hypothetical protein GY854_23160 [Deltaproteobacteria bacterium]|nr:hypothetical protein [Deltaproteobacteria bacterium]
MGISDITAKLDFSASVSTMLGDLVAPTATISATSSPVSGNEMSASVEVSAEVNTAGLESAITGITQQVPEMVASLPGVDDVVSPILNAIELAEKITLDDPAAQIEALIKRLSGELGGSREGDFLDFLDRFGDLLKDAPELRGFIELVSTAFRSGGIQFEPGELLDGLLPAVIGTIRGLGALMNMESTLAEGERLTGIMSQQIDSDRIMTALAALRSKFTSEASVLSTFIANIDEATPEQIDLAVRSVDLCAVRFAETERLLVESMGFGEATLVHFDVDRLEANVNAAIGLLRNVDTNAIARVFQALLDRIGPIFNLDLEEAAVSSLEELFLELESRTSEMASTISSIDVTGVLEPIQLGVGGITGAIGGFTDIVTQVTTSIQTALEQVRQVVAALPFGEIADAIQMVMEPVSMAMEAVQSLIDGIEAALETAANAVIGALTQVETVVDTFTDTVNALLGDAATFIESLNLDQVIGQVADNINAFADILAKAQMKPYFDSANGVIDSTADVIDALPLSLLPESVKADLDAAVAPIRAINVPGVKEEVIGWFLIQDGKFELRGPIEDSLSELQTKYDNLIINVETVDPRNHIETINTELDKVKDKILDLLPEINLQPVRDAIANVKDSLGGFDLSEQLAPLDDAFGSIIDIIDEYSPAQYIQPLEDRVAAARETVKTAIRLDTWTPKLDELSSKAEELIDRVNPEHIEPAIASALNEAHKLIERMDDVPLTGFLGSFIASMLSGSGQRVQPWSYKSVSSWLAGDSGGEALAERGARIHEHIEATKASIEIIDIEALSIELAESIQNMRAEISVLPAEESVSIQLNSSLGRLHVVGPSLAAIASNRTRYLSAIEQAATRTDTLRRTGLSQVGVTIDDLQSAFSPANILVEFFRAIFAQLGISNFEGGVTGVLGRVLDAVTPQRLAGIFVPIFEALRERFAALIHGIIDPLKEGVAALEGAIDSITLAPLIGSIELIQEEVKEQIELLSPANLLGPTIDSFDALRADLLDFNPLASLDAVLNQFEVTINNIRAKLDAEELLAAPIRIYDEIMDALRALSIDNLLAPVFDELDNLAAQIDGCLDETVASLEHLQDALPAGGGGSSVSVSVSVG